MKYIQRWFKIFFPLSPVGSLSILKALDREEQEVFNLTIVAEDHGIPQLSTSQVLCVQVIDVNDEAPLFQRAEFEAQVMENKGPGTTVLTVTAADRDQGWFTCVISILYGQDAGNRDIQYCSTIQKGLN